jgi:hypothetical protein
MTSHSFFLADNPHFFPSLSDRPSYYINDEWKKLVLYVTIFLKKRTNFISKIIKLYWKWFTLNSFHSKLHYNGWLLKFSLKVGYGSFFVFRCTLDIDKFDISINVFSLNLVMFQLYWLTFVVRSCVCLK